MRTLTQDTTELNAIEHTHLLTFIYNHNCRLCEVLRFEHQLPLGGSPPILRQYVEESPTLTYWDKQRLIEKFNL